MSVIQVKKPLTKLFVLLLLALFIALPLFALLPAKSEAQPENNWTINGSLIYIDDDRVYLSADPHTLGSPGWVTFTLQTKQYTGDIDVVWGFDLPTVKPQKAEIYKPYWYNWTTNFSETFYYVSSFALVGPEVPCDYGFSYNTYHYQVNHAVPQFDEETNITGWQPTTSIVCFDNYSKNGVNYTVSWCEEHSKLIEWQSFEGDFTIINQEHGGMNTWYVLKNVPVVAGKEYVIRAWVDIPFSPEPIIGKYWWCVKPSFYSIPEAIAENVFYSLDPWYDVDWPYRKCLNITGSAGAGTNYQVKLLIGQNDSVTGENFSLGDLSQPDFDDIRFTDDDGVTLLPYWVESVSAGVATTWVNVSDDLNSSEEIFIYYGNSLATTASDGEATFLFFDDWDRADSGTVGNGWTEEQDNKFAIDTNRLKITEVGSSGWDSCYKAFTASRKIRIDALFYPTSTDVINGLNFHQGTDENAIEFYSTPKIRYLVAGSWVYSDAFTANNWYKLSVAYDPSVVKARYFINDVLKQDWVAAGSVTGNEIIAFEAYQNGQITYCQYILVRSYTDSEPAFACVCGEEEYCIPTPTNLQNESGNFYVNYTWEDGAQGDCYCVLDSYNISWENATDSGWQNGTTDYYFNWTTNPHGYVNVSIYAYSEACDLLSAPVSDSVCFENNPISISNCTNVTVMVGETVDLDFDYSDGDNDVGEFNTDFIYGDLNTSTGEFIWVADDWGVFVACFNVSDGYGSVDECCVTITVNTPGFLIADPYNNITSNESLSLFIAVSIPCYFSINSSSKPVDSWHWSLNNMLFENDYDNFTASGFSEGVYFLSVYALNTSYGESNVITWMVLVGEKGLTYLLTLQLVEEQEMLADMWLFLVLLLIDFALIFFVFWEVRDIFYGDGTVTIASILASLLSVVLSFILSFQSLLTPVEMPALNYFMLAVAMVMSIIFIRFIIQVLAQSIYAMRARNF